MAVKLSPRGHKLPRAQACFLSNVFGDPRSHPSRGARIAEAIHAHRAPLESETSSGTAPPPSRPFSSWAPSEKVKI